VRKLTHLIVFMPSPSRLSSVKLVRLTDVIEVEVVDSLEREAVDEPGVGWQSPDGYFIDDSIDPFGDNNDGEGIGEVISEDWHGGHQGEKWSGEEFHVDRSEAQS
jgi:hypothetical protein